MDALSRLRAQFGRALAPGMRHELASTDRNREKGRITMKYSKPTLSLAGTAQALVLGTFPGDGDHSKPTMANTSPLLLGLGLDD
jgi:hypothetical protein